MKSEFQIMQDINETVLKHESKVAFQVDNAIAEFIKQETIMGKWLPIGYVMTLNIQKIADAIKKQMPKKAKHNYCSNCGTNYSFITDNLANPKGHSIIYCWNCGQAIDWSDKK